MSAAVHTETDGDLALGLLLAIGGDPSDVHSVVIAGEPPTKARPRFSRGGHAYTSAASREAEERTRSRLLRWTPEPMTGNVAMACVFWRPDRTRVDVDNMLKHLCDAANGVLWHDDSQVTALVGIAQLDRDHPRTLIALGHHVSSLTRGTDDVVLCSVCQTPFPRRGESSTTCSRRCSLISRGIQPLDVPVACAMCGLPFARTSRSQRMCSDYCRAAARRTPRARKPAAGESTC